MHYASFRLYFHRNFPFLYASLRFSIIPTLRPSSFVGGNKRMRRARFIFIKELIFIRSRVDSFLLVHLPPRFPFPPGGSQVYLVFRCWVWRVSRVMRTTRRRDVHFSDIRLLRSGSYDIRLLRNKIYCTYTLDILNKMSYYLVFR